MANHQKKVKWYDDGGIIVSLIIFCIVVIIFSSQSFVGGEKLTFELVGSIINHNSMYFVLLIYFIFLNFRFGKKYFNYFNVILIFLYALTTVTSFLTILQSFSLATVLTFTIHFVFFIYLIHTMARGTRFWKDFHFSNSPFNELTNEWLFCCILVLSTFILAVQLISTSAVNGVIISVLDSVYFVLFGRYIYLYREFLDHKKIDSNNVGNFDEVREIIKDKVENVSDTVQGVLDKTEIDEKIGDAAGKVVHQVDNIGKEIDRFIDDNHINEKVNDTMNDISKEISKIDDTVTKKKRKSSVKKEKPETIDKTVKKGEN